MVAIDVDFEVFKELTVRRLTETMTENEVIRELLGMSKVKRAAPASSSGGVPWVTKGVSFPHGTEFRATYKGREYLGQVQNGALVVNGTRYTSPSAAAVAITDNPVNGWRFWSCRFPGETKWQLARRARK